MIYEFWYELWFRHQFTPTSFQVSSTRLIRYVNSSMVLDIDFGSIQNWMYEYLYIWFFSLDFKKSLFRLKLAFIFNQSVYYLFNKIKISSDDFLRKDVIDNFQTSYLFLEVVWIYVNFEELSFLYPIFIRKLNKLLN